MWGYSSGFLSLLEEDEPELRAYGIKQLLEVVDLEWAQIAEKIDVINNFAKDQENPNRHMAALLSSKTYYRLGDKDKATEFALLSGNNFDPTNTDDYTNVIVSNLIERCIKTANKEEPLQESAKTVLTSVLQNMMNNGDYAACLCIAVESRMIEFVKAAVQALPALVPEAINLVLVNVTAAGYRQELLRLLAEYIKGTCAATQIAKLHHNLGDPSAVGDLIVTLALSEEKDNKLLAYQIAFNLAENAGQDFRKPIIDMIPENLPAIRNILTRNTPLALNLKFLFDKSTPDMEIINGLVAETDTDYSPNHTSAVFAYSMMLAGTGDDLYYRNNIQWFGKSTKWNKFFNIAAVGAIHLGHLDHALTVLGGFLSSQSISEAKGGALFALGLIYANYTWDEKVLQTVRDAIQRSRQMYVQYGAALALGLIGLGSHNADDANIFSEIIHREPAEPEAGEAAGYALGMTMLGCGPNENLKELIEFVESCPHGKITRGLSMAFALMMYGCEQKADGLFEQFLGDRQPLLRESAAWILALAYVGTGNNSALQRLLHIAVSDTNSEVRRAAVIGVGFVLSRSPERIPEMLSLLAISYHPYVRAGSALAIGIACAGTAMPEAVELMKPLLEDKNPLVKQHAMIGMALLLQQQSDAAVPYCKDFRAAIRKHVNKRTGELYSFGVGAAYGILNAAGRNAVVSCNTLRGENSIIATVALALFTNYFFFMPLSLMLPLAFHTTAMIGLDENLNVVDWPVMSNARPALFANPPSFNSEKPTTKLADAVALSITKKRTKEEEEAEKARIAEEAKKKLEEMEMEPVEELLMNPMRVTLSQFPHIDTTFSNDWEPITEAKLGFVMLRHK